MWLMKNALILHGTDANHTDHWFTWLAKELANLGYKTWVPDLPGADKPSIERYNKFLLNSEFDFNDETIIVGHSSGAVEILGLLSYPDFPKEIKVTACFLVGAFKGDLGWDLKGMNAKFNYDLIKSRSNKFILIHSDSDPYCPIEDAKDLSSTLDGKFIEIPNQGHFNTGFSPKFVKFPKLLEIIKQEI